MCFWTHEKKTFFSYQHTTRSGAVSQGRAILRAAQRAKRLYGRRSGGYAGNISSQGYRSLSLLFVALVSVLVAAQEPSFGR
jgi:hypothetical protein